MNIKTTADARKYIAKVQKQNSKGIEHCCEHGHFACAEYEGGPCENEVAAQFDLLDES